MRPDETAPDEGRRFGRTIRVEGGIKAQSTRGAIGATWWSKRFIAVLESFALGTRLSRGRNYARAGQVLSLDVTPGTVTASVQGSRHTPYEVRISIPVLDEDAWQAVESALAEQAIFSAHLLAGVMPAEIEDVFTSAGTSLFPTDISQLTMTCSCPDVAVPCKHIAATFYLLAEAFDADPFQILHWRGRDRASLLARLSELRGGPRPRRKAKKAGPPPAAAGAALALTDVASPTLEQTVDRFWLPPVPLPARPATLATDVDLLLRQLPPPPPSIGGAELLQRLRTLYAALGEQSSS